MNAFATAAILLAQAYASADPPPSPAFTGSIVVTADRLEETWAEAASSVSILTREDIERLPATTLADVLDHVLGYDVSTAIGGEPVITSRGFFGGGEVGYVQILVDGIVVNDAESGLADWRAIGTDEIERVEILRGLGSASFGDASLGGVVHVFRRTSGGSARVSAGSQENVELSARAARSGPLQVRGGAHHRSTEGIRDHAAWETSGGDLTVERKWTNRELSLSLWGARRSSEDPGAVPLDGFDWQEADPLFLEDREDRDEARAAARFAFDGFGARWRTSLHHVVRESDQVTTLLLAPGLADTQRKTAEIDRTAASVESERAFVAGRRPWRIAAGVELGRAAASVAYAPVTDPHAATAHDAVRRSGSAWLSADVRPSPRVRLVAAGRFDRIVDRGAAAESTVSAFSPRIGGDVLFGPAESPYAVFLSLTRAFKAPTLEQKFDPRPLPDFAGGTFSVSNALLEPQKARGAEIGVRREAAAYRWEIVAYRTRIDDEIDFDLRTFRYANIARSLHRGVEAGVRLSPGGALSGSASWAWARVESLDAPGLQLKNIPEHVARVDVSLTRALPVDLTLSAELLSGLFYDDANEVRAGTEPRIDVRLARDVGRFRVVADVENIFDAETAPAGFVLHDFSGSPVTYVYPEAQRTVRFGVEWRFPVGPNPPSRRR